LERSPQDVFRRQQQKAHVLQELLERLGIGRGDRILDIGSGPGYASLLAAEKVGPEGVVWAIDSDEAALAHLRQTRRERGVTWLHTLVADAATFTPPEAGITRFLLADTLHHTPDPGAILRHLAEVLPPGSRGVVSDYDPAVERRVGAPLAMRLPEERVRAWLESAGFVIEEAWRPPDEHYAFLVRRP